MSKYDTGSVVPRFHSEKRRLQLAFLVIIEENELDGSPQLIVRPAKKILKKAKINLEEGNAPDFVEDFQKEQAHLEMIQTILKILSKEKGCDLMTEDRTQDHRQ